MSVALLHSDEIRAMVPMSLAIEAVRAGFMSYGAGEFTALQFWEEADSYVVKSVVHRPSQTMALKALTVDAQRRPLVSGVVTMLDRTTGDTVVADAATVTSMRTGAIVGVATDLLAAPDATRLVLIGAGAQAADQYRAVRAVRPLTSLVVVNRDIDRAVALVDTLGEELSGIAVRTDSDPSPAVNTADIICCATTTTQPLFGAAALPKRVHVNAIGSFRPQMRELPTELFGTASTVLVDDRGAVQGEAGEIISALKSGALGLGDLVELAEALRHPPARGGRTVFKTVGIAVQDWALMRAIADALWTASPTGKAASADAASKPGETHRPRVQGEDDLMRPTDTASEGHITCD